MHRAVSFIFMGVFGTLTVLSAADYTFGPVPPPSRFSGETLHAPITNTYTAVPSVIPPVIPPVIAPTNPLVSEKPDLSSAFKPVAPAPKPDMPTVQAEPPPEAKPVLSSPSQPEPKLIVEPGAGGIDGKIALVDEQGRFVVLTFPLGQMPGPGASLNAYRHGVKVGEITITGPQRDDNTVADVISGELKVGDAVRNR
jgi:hypothetical protein